MAQRFMVGAKWCEAKRQSMTINTQWSWPCYACDFDDQKIVTDYPSGSSCMLGGVKIRACGLGWCLCAIVAVALMYIRGHI